MVDHWNENGHDFDRANRNGFYNDIDTMGVRLKGPNSSVGGKVSAAGVRYRPGCWRGNYE